MLNHHKLQHTLELLSSGLAAVVAQTALPTTWTMPEVVGAGVVVMGLVYAILRRVAAVLIDRALEDMDAQKAAVAALTTAVDGLRTEVREQGHKLRQELMTEVTRVVTDLAVHKGAQLEWQRGIEQHLELLRREGNHNNHGGER